MATLFNQTNLSPGTSFAGSGGGGGGGSNFGSISTGTITVSSITFLPNVGIVPPSIGTRFSGDLNIPVTGNFVWFPYYSNYNDSLMVNNNGLYFTPASGSGTPYNIYNAVLKNASTVSLSNVYQAQMEQASFTKNTTDTNVTYTPLSFTLRPDQASKGGGVQAIFQWDAVDTGANYATVVGARSDSGFIGTVWPGYISMPMEVFGATVSLVSDNETFLFCDGKEGAQGTISTGVSFLSSSNEFSSITTPLRDTANMAALFSTLKSVYPDCFN